MLQKFLRAASALAIGGALVVAGACSRQPIGDAQALAHQPAVIAPVVTVVRRNVANELEIASEFIPYQEIDVHAKVSGYVEKLLVNWGTHVRAGQLMAVLEVPELEAQVSRDKAGVEQSQQNVAAADEELIRDQTAYHVAHLTYTRLEGVEKTQPGLVAQEDVDVAQGKDQEAAAAVSAAKDALAAAREELSVNQSTLRRDQAMFGYSRITAPFNGVVTKLNAYTGSLLPAGTSSSANALPLCHLSQTDLLRLVIPVPARVVQDVHIGEVVEVRVVALNKDFQGRVARFSGQIDLETRTMHTEVDVPNPDYTLVPGMYATVELPIKSARNALTLPIQAVENSQQGQGTVLVVNDQGEIESRNVALGLETANAVQILSGVTEGEMVIFGEQSRYHPGETVKPSPVDLASVERAH